MQQETKKNRMLANREERKAYLLSKLREKKDSLTSYMMTDDYQQLNPKVLTDLSDEVVSNLNQIRVLDAEIDLIVEHLD